MIRAVLVGWTTENWRLYRQPQWMAEVRRNPEVTSLPRHHFDIGDDDFDFVLDAWTRKGAGTSLEAARTLLTRFGAVEIAGP